MFLRESCALAGVSNESVYAWMRKGQRDINDGLETVEASFSRAMKRAMAKAEKDMVENVRMASTFPQFWAAGAWYLERKFPERYGKRDRVALEHSGQMGIGMVEADSLVSESLTSDEKRQAAKQLAANLAILGGTADSEIRGTDSVSPSSYEWEGGDTEAPRIPEWEAD